MELGGAGRCIGLVWEATRNYCWEWRAGSNRDLTAEGLSRSLKMRGFDVRVVVVDVLKLGPCNSTAILDPWQL